MPISEPPESHSVHSEQFNAAQWFLDYRKNGIADDKPAFIHEGVSLSYQELAARSGLVGGVLQKLGLAPESRIALIVHDTLSFPPLFLGAIRSGIVPIPLNTLLAPDQYRHILLDAGVQAVFVSAALLGQVRSVVEELPELPHLVVCDGAGEGLPELDQLLQDATPVAGHDTHRDATAFWLYSSGSTGMPKGVRHVHTSMMETARFYAQPILGITRDDICYSAAKLFFAYGLGNALSFPLSVGATTILASGRPTPDAVFANLKHYQPTLFFGAPTLYAAMLASEKAPDDNTELSLRLCVSAGEALPADIGERWQKRYGVEILDGIGSTEMLHIFVSNRPGEVRYGSSGVPVPNYQARLVDENDQPVGPGEIGELLIKGTTSADGYWNQREKSRRTFMGEWTRTGDKYTCDSDGFYTYCGRTDDMFKVSGQWVSPFEVESALVSHPAVVEAAVVPDSDENDLIKPRAYVILKEGKDSQALFDELKEHVKDQIGKWKYPRWINVVDSLPKTATGKIQRFKLRT